MRGITKLRPKSHAPAATSALDRSVRCERTKYRARSRDGGGRGGDSVHESSNGDGGVEELAVVSIHPDPSHPLGLDLKDILAVLGNRLNDWVWCVKNLDWLGEESESLCEAVEAAGPDGVWIDSRALLEAARGIYQTIEGRFLAFPRSIEKESLEASDYSLIAFPASPAALAIVAVDGGCFDVYSKDPETTQNLHDAFPIVGDENLEHYF